MVTVGMVDVAMATNLLDNSQCAILVIGGQQSLVVSDFLQILCFLSFVHICPFEIGFS